MTPEEAARLRGIWAAQKALRKPKRAKAKPALGKTNEGWCKKPPAWEPDPTVIDDPTKNPFS